MNAQHQSNSNEHYTPPHIVEACREVMREIHVDPASCQQVNEWSVKADVFFDHDGIEQLRKYSEKRGRLKVFCNPPGGKTGNESNMKTWLLSIYDMWIDDLIDEAFFLLFNREFLGLPELATIPRLNFSQRVKYWGWNDFVGEFMEGNWKVTHVGGGVLKQCSKIYVIEECLPNPLLPDQTDTWSINYPDGGIAATAPTLAKAIALCKRNLWDYRIWVNSPTHQSTLLYFPSVRGDGLDKVWTLNEVFRKHGITDPWLIPATRRGER